MSKGILHLKKKKVKATLEHTVPSYEEVELLALPIPTLGKKLTPGQWVIQKQVRRIQNGNLEDTRRYLTELKDMELKNEESQAVVFASGLLDTLVNILESGDMVSKITSIEILEALCFVDLYHRYLCTINIGVAMCSNLVGDYNSRKMVLKLLCLFKLVTDRKIVQAEAVASNAIGKLLGYLNVDSGILQKVTDEVKTGDRFDRLILAAEACSCLSLLASEKHFYTRFLELNGPKIIQKLFEARSTVLIISVITLIEELSKYEDIISAFNIDQLVSSLLNTMRQPNSELQVKTISCLSSITHFTPAIEVFIRYKGVERFVYFLKRKDVKRETSVIKCVTKALSNCGMKPNTVKKLREMNLIDYLAPYVTGEDEELVAPCCILLSQIATSQESVALLRYGEVLQSVIKLISTATNPTLIVAAISIVSNSIDDKANVEIVEHEEAAKFLWSLLNHEEPEVIAAAVGAIAKISMVSESVTRSSHFLAGGLEKLVILLDHTVPSVVLSCTRAISQLAKDQAALDILIDHSVIVKLARLTKTKKPKLQHAVAEAVAICSSSTGAASCYGKCKGIKHLIRYLWSRNRKIQRGCVLALAQLSVTEDNCMEIAQHGAINVLILMTSSYDKEERKAAAATIANIRRLTRFK
ncbi:outer dynein arm-docking complex subunit 2-like isoform X2 [Artemia franciscana]|uniref:Uncharacterized protein n=1 Tax=Artemia franciscana TaxID=6661 RepID=A0AA88KS35_ARTSF|nr:hypothetical protein QYM36_017657 [Artemia franciscana]